MLSGYGLGRSLRGPVSVTYGLTLEEAENYLKLPQGKVIRRTEKDMELGPI